MINKYYAFQCPRYMYYGKVVKTDEDTITIEDAEVIFETGAFNSDKPDISENLPKGTVIIFKKSIEAMYETLWSTQ